MRRTCSSTRATAASSRAARGAKARGRRRRSRWRSATMSWARRFAAAVAGRWRRRRQPPQGALERLVGRAPQRPALLLAEGVELVHAHPRRLGDRTHRLLRLDVAASVIGDFFGREPLAHVGHGITHEKTARREARAADDGWAPRGGGPSPAGERTIFLAEERHAVKRAVLGRGMS